LGLKSLLDDAKEDDSLEEKKRKQVGCPLKINNAYNTVLFSLGPFFHVLVLFYLAFTLLYFSMDKLVLSFCLTGLNLV
jgi:hypothetical protein